MDINEYKRRIIETLEQMDESDRKFLRQIFTLLRMHTERKGHEQQ